MQYRFDSKGSNALSQCRAAHQMHGMVGAVVGVHLSAHNLAAVQIQNQIQVKPATNHVAGKYVISQHQT
jgi:hypothetical protein